MLPKTISFALTSEGRQKYRKGYEEHGGQMRKMSDTKLTSEAWSEIIDLLHYIAEMERRGI